MAMMGLWAFILYTGLVDDIKQKNKTLETIPSRFSLNKKQRSLFLTSSVSSTRSLDWNLKSKNILTNCQFIYGQGKVYNRLLVWKFKELCLWQPCLNKLMHVEN